MRFNLACRARIDIRHISHVAPPTYNPGFPEIGKFLFDFIFILHFRKNAAYLEQFALKFDF